MLTRDIVVRKVGCTGDGESGVGTGHSSRDGSGEDTDIELDANTKHKVGT